MSDTPAPALAARFAKTDAGRVEATPSVLAARTGGEARVEGVEGDADGLLGPKRANRVSDEGAWRRYLVHASESPLPIFGRPRQFPRPIAGHEFPAQEITAEQVEHIRHVRRIDIDQHARGSAVTRRIPERRRNLIWRFKKPMTEIDT